MAFIKGLEKFGLGKKAEQIRDITEKPLPEKRVETVEQKEKVALTEADYLMRKTFVCPVCDQKIKALVVRGTRLRRLDPEDDLRPRYVNVDIIKYDTVVCPNCGYASMANSFESVSHNQIKRLKEHVMANFRPDFSLDDRSVYTAEEAIDRYKLCLISATVKNVNLSEKAYICLKTAWLFRDMLKELPEDSKERDELLEQYNDFYRQAYDGFSKALQTEIPPICGMDVTTVEYLVANLAAYFDDYPVAIRYLGNLILSKSVSYRMKDRCRDLRDELRKKKDGIS